MDLGLTGRVAVVAAASKGLGLGAAQALSAEGVRLVISSRSEENLAAATGIIAGDCVTVAADMDDPDTPALLVDTALERYGRLDIAVANNGGPPPAGSLDITDDQVLAAVNANQLASVRLVRAASGPMRAAGWGRICCIASSTVKQPSPALPLSNMARTGLWAWVKTAAPELAGDGITLNLACPGLHRTERIGALNLDGRMGEPEDFGAVVAFLCSEQARFITGTAVVVDGGATSGLV